MTVQSVKAGADPEILTVGMSDGSFFIFRTVYLDEEAPRPRVELVLSDDAEALYRRAAEIYAAELAAIRLIAIREHSRFLLSLKLRRREFGESAIRVVLDRFESMGLLDDERFAVLWLEARIGSKHEGRAKLLAALLGRGVSREIAERALGKTLLEESEIEALRRFAEKAHIDVAKLDEKARRALRSAGFSGKTIRAAASAENNR
jgi:regulatory protein